MANIIKNGRLIGLGLVDVVRRGVDFLQDREVTMNRVLNGRYIERATVLDMTHCAIKVRFTKSGHDKWIQLTDVLQNEREGTGHIRLNVFQQGIATYQVSKIAERRFDTPEECLWYEQSILSLNYHDVFTHVEVWDEELVLTDEEGNEEEGDWTDWYSDDYDDWDSYKFAVAGIPLPEIKQNKQ